MPLVLRRAALESTAVGQSFGAPLNPGDILYTDSGNAIDGGFIVKVDPATGLKTVISSGNYLRSPFGLAISANGQIFVSDSGRLLGIAPDTGAQTVIADNSSGLLGLPYGIALNRGGDILAANLEAVIDVDPGTGQIQTVSAGGSFLYPSGVAVATDHQLFVLNLALPSQVIRVNPQTGAQRVVAQGGYLNTPQSIAIHDNDIYVTDSGTLAGKFGIGRVIHIDAHSGLQTVVAQGRNLVGPVGIAVDPTGQLIVGDPYTINPQSRDIASGGYDGAIIRIDPASGWQFLLARGEGSIENPRGVAIVPNPRPGP